MEGVYDPGAVYSIANVYLLDRPRVSVYQIGGINYDSLNNKKRFEFNGFVTVVPIGFDVKRQAVIVSTNEMRSTQTVSETYAMYSEMRHRTVGEDEENLPCIAYVKKEDFILHATLVV